VCGTNPCGSVRGPLVAPVDVKINSWVTQQSEIVTPSKRISCFECLKSRALLGLGLPEYEHCHHLEYGLCSAKWSQLFGEKFCLRLQK
jgi:hypothetical protein